MARSGAGVSAGAAKFGLGQTTGSGGLHGLPNRFLHPHTAPPGQVTHVRSHEPVREPLSIKISNVNKEKALRISTQSAPSTAKVMQIESQSACGRTRVSAGGCGHIRLGQTTEHPPSWRPASARGIRSTPPRPPQLRKSQTGIYYSSVSGSKVANVRVRVCTRSA